MGRSFFSGLVNKGFKLSYVRNSIIRLRCIRVILCHLKMARLLSAKMFCSFLTQTAFGKVKNISCNILYTSLS